MTMAGPHGGHLVGLLNPRHAMPQDVDGRAVDPALGTFATSLSGPARQQVPNRFGAGALVARPGDKVGNVIVAVIRQVEAAYLLDAIGMEVVFQRPHGGHERAAARAFVDQFRGALTQLCFGRCLAIVNMQFSKTERGQRRAPRRNVAATDWQKDQFAGALALAQIRRRAVGDVQHLADAAKKLDVIAAFDDDDQLGDGW